MHDYVVIPTMLTQVIPSDAAQLEHQLNQYAIKGYQLVETLTTAYSVMFIMERERKPHGVARPTAA